MASAERKPIMGVWGRAWTKGARPPKPPSPVIRALPPNGFRVRSAWRAIRRPHFTNLRGVQSPKQNVRRLTIIRESSIGDATRRLRGCCHRRMSLTPLTGLIQPASSDVAMMVSGGSVTGHLSSVSSRVSVVRCFVDVGWLVTPSGRETGRRTRRLSADNDLRHGRSLERHQNITRP